MFQVNAPTSSHKDEKVEELHEGVAKIMEKNRSYYKIIMGDFNIQCKGRAATPGRWRNCWILRYGRSE